MNKSEWVNKDTRAYGQWKVFTVQFAVHEIWINDGFTLDNERALEMLSHDLGYANCGSEIDARIIESKPTTFVEHKE